MSVQIHSGRWTLVVCGEATWHGTLFWYSSGDIMVTSFIQVKWSESRSVVSDSLWPHGLYSPWNSPGQNSGVGNLSLLQWIFPTQESNQGLLHCRQILYQLSYQGSPIYPNLDTKKKQLWWSFIFQYLVVYFWLPWIFIAARGLSQSRQVGLLSSCNVWASHYSGFSCCGAQDLGVWASVVEVLWLESTGSVVVLRGLAMWHVESSQTGDGIHVPCTGRQILNHWTTKKVPQDMFY